VLTVEDWAEIRRLRKSEGVSISEIARLMGCSRNTVKAALASDGPPQYVRVRSGSLVDAYEPRIRELLAAFPRMPATVIAERVGWPYSIRTLSTRVAELRVRRICRRTRRAGRPMPPARSRNVISGSPISSCRSDSDRPAPRGCCRC
jgi:transposase